MLKHLISYIFILSIFLSSLMINIGGVSFDIYWYFPLFIIALFFLIYAGILYKIDRNILNTILFITCLSIISGYSNLNIVIKQLTNVYFFLIISYAYLKYMNFDLDSILNYYFSVAKIFLVIGFIQITLFAVGLGNIYKSAFSFLTIPGSVTIRFQSFDREPSFAAYTLLPALFIGVQNIFYGSKLTFQKLGHTYLFLRTFLHFP